MSQRTLHQIALSKISTFLYDKERVEEQECIELLQLALHRKVLCFHFKAPNCMLWNILCKILNLAISHRVLCNAKKGLKSELLASCVYLHNTKEALC